MGPYRSREVKPTGIMGRGCLKGYSFVNVLVRSKELCSRTVSVTLSRGLYCGLQVSETEWLMLSVITETSLSPLLGCGSGRQLARNINKSQAITIYTSSVLPGLGDKRTILSGNILICECLQQDQTFQWLCVNSNEVTTLFLVTNKLSNFITHQSKLG